MIVASDGNTSVLKSISLTINIAGVPSQVFRWIRDTTFKESLIQIWQLTLMLGRNSIPSQARMTSNPPNFHKTDDSEWWRTNQGAKSCFSSPTKKNLQKTPASASAPINGGDEHWIFEQWILDQNNITGTGLFWKPIKGRFPLSWYSQIMIGPRQ